MQQIEFYIKNLLVENEQVIIPGFGGIAKKPVSSEIKENQITPPKKQLVYIYQDDDPQNILICSIQEQESISSDDAISKVEQFVKEVKEALLLKGEFKLEGLGKLIKENDIIDFIEEEPKGIFSDSFGLELIEIDTPEKIPDEITTEELPAYVHEKSNKTLWTVLVIFLLLTPIVFVLITRTNIVNNIAELFQRPDTIASIETVADAKADSILEASYDSIDRSTAEKIASLNNRQSALTPDGISDPENDYYSQFNKFFLVMGSFDNKDRALTLKKDLIKRGYNKADIVYTDKKYRVYVFSFKNREEALKKLEMLRRDYNSKVWILNYKE